MGLSLVSTMHSTTFFFIVIGLTALGDAEDGHFFEKKVQDGKKTIIKNGMKEVITVKKVFVSLYIGFYKYRQKKFYGEKRSGKFESLLCLYCL